jgi:hypothetical protein
MSWLRSHDEDRCEASIVALENRALSMTRHLSSDVAEVS